jgi:hypothetical protein
MVELLLPSGEGPHGRPEEPQSGAGNRMVDFGTSAASYQGRVGLTWGCRPTETGRGLRHCGEGSTCFRTSDPTVTDSSIRGGPLVGWDGSRPAASGSGGTYEKIPRQKWATSSSPGARVHIGDRIQLNRRRALEGWTPGSQLAGSRSTGAQQTGSSGGEDPYLFARSPMHSHRLPSRTRSKRITRGLYFRPSAGSLPARMGLSRGPLADARHRSGESASRTRTGMTAEPQAPVGRCERNGMTMFEAFIGVK